MKSKFLFLALLLISVTGFSQERGEIWTELSADLTNSTITNSPISPSILYYPIDNIGVRVSGFYQDADGGFSSSVQLAGRVYVTPNGYAQGGIVTDFQDNTGYTLSLGYTGHLTNWFYVEPSIKYYHENTINDVGISLGIGIVLNNR